VGAGPDPPPPGRLNNGIDGLDQSALLTGQTVKSARDRWFYFHRGALKAVRKDQWKLMLAEKELFDLENDPGEQENVAAEHPEKAGQLLKLAEWAKTNLQPIQAVVENRKDKQTTR